MSTSNPAPGAVMSFATRRSRFSGKRSVQEKRYAVVVYEVNALQYAPFFEKRTTVRVGDRIAVRGAHADALEGIEDVELGERHR